MLDTGADRPAAGADDLLHRQVERVAQPQVRDQFRLPDGEAGRLARGQVRRADAVPLDEDHTSLSPPRRVDGDPGRAQGLHVAQHRAHGDLEAPGEHRGREATVRLEQQHQ